MGKIIVIEGSHCSGKSTTIRSLCSNYGFMESKSVPEWFREYIPYARSKGYEEQMIFYEIGHKASYSEARNSIDDFVFDRWVYTTIVRLNYDKGISVEETVNQILNYNLTPDMVFILSTSPQTIIERRILRDNDANINTNFYVYENSVFKKLNNHPKFAIINNDRDIMETTEEIVEILRTNKIIGENNVRRKIK